MQNMVPTPWLIPFLKQYERFRPTAYKPTAADVWTIGYGHTDGVKPGDVCTLAEANEHLENDVAMRAVLWVNRLVTARMTPNQFDALCSLTFNCGVAPLQRTLGHDLNAGDYASASAQFLIWDKQAGKELDGLENRRVAERAHFDTP